MPDTPKFPKPVKSAFPVKNLQIKRFFHAVCGILSHNLSTSPFFLHNTNNYPNMVAISKFLFLCPLFAVLQYAQSGLAQSVFNIFHFCWLQKTRNSILIKLFFQNVEKSSNSAARIFCFLGVLKTTPPPLNLRIWPWWNGLRHLGISFLSTQEYIEV